MAAADEAGANYALRQPPVKQLILSAAIPQPEHEFREFNIDKANAVLDAAGYRRGADGVREKGGRRLRFVFQTSINAPRQKAQAIVKQAAQKAGIEIELKAVVAGVFFSSDVANPDTFQKFFASEGLALAARGDYAALRVSRMSFACRRLKFRSAKIAGRY